MFFFGMIGGLGKLLLRFFILIYLSVQVIRKLVSLMFWVTMQRNLEFDIFLGIFMIGN